MRALLGPFLCFTLTAVAQPHARDPFLLDDQSLTQRAAARGQDALHRIEALTRLLHEASALSERERLEAVNRFFNQARFVSDAEQWGVEDYWATPAEFLLQDAGDCEDFALAKYFALLRVGVPPERLRLTYVNALALGQPHMVLAYYPRPEAEPLVLDNLMAEIRPASLRPDLKPVYSFNGVGLWLAKERGQGRLAGGPGRLDRWVELNRRIDQGSARP